MSYEFHPQYAEVLRYPAAMDRLRPPYLGVDFEWDLRTGNPTVIGVSDGQTTVSTDFGNGWDAFMALLDRFPEQWSFIGHNFIRAERPILSRFGISILLDKVQDTIVWHYLTSAHLCKAGGKALGDDSENEKRGPGFMNIWTMCSIWTSEMNWKFCRGSECIGVPCPKHEPFWYNGLDSRNPVLALLGMIRKAKLIGVDHLYPLHARLMEQFEIMQQRGVWVDLNYISKLKIEFEAAKGRLWKDGQKDPTPESMPFNPESWQQVKRYFKDKYDLTVENTQEETIRYLAEDHSEIPELQDLLEYKELGSGPDRWYAPREWNTESQEWIGYVVEQGGGLGTIHPNVNVFTSTGRMACSNPNMQNIEKRRIDRKTGEKLGEKLRQAVIAPPGYRLYSADYSNAEARVFLHLAGYELPLDKDLINWMIDIVGLKETDDFSITFGSAREAAKRVTHAQDNLMGLDLISPEKLRSARIKSEIAAGAREVHMDWKFRNSYVSFTGSKLAIMAFGAATYANRRRAIEAGNQYMKVAFPKARDVHRRVMKQIEMEGAVKTPHGYVLYSYDRSPNEQLKTAASMWCQNPVAHFLKLSLLNLEAHPRLVPILPVHDENLVLASEEYDPKEVKKWIQECMIIETPEMPGFTIPIKVKHGPNWREMTKIE